MLTFVFLILACICLFLLLVNVRKEVYKLPGPSSVMSSVIPKLIFQTSATEEMPPGMVKAVDSWKSRNPTYKHLFFDADNRRKFICKHFGNDVVKAYDSLIPGAYKADLWRYCVIYIHGGVYADVKSVCKVSLDDILDSPFVSIRDTAIPEGGADNGAFSITQSFLCAVPRHPFLKRAIELTITNVLNRDYGEGSLDITGPRVLGRALNDVLGRPQDSTFAFGKQSVNSFEFTLFEEHFHNGKEIIVPKYHNHDKEKNNWGIDYGDAYHKRTVFT